MSLEFIIFILAALFGIFIYWTESKNNFLYRFVNKLTHTKDLQMKSAERKGFLFNQPLVYRIIYIVVFYIIVFAILRFLTPFNTVGIIYFTNFVVGTILGTYIASLIVKANDTIADGHDIIEETLEKGKDYIKDLTDDVKDKVDDFSEKSEKKEVSENKKEERKEEKSGRDRLKDKGLL